MTSPCVRSTFQKTGCGAETAKLDSGLAVPAGRSNPKMSAAFELEGATHACQAAASPPGVCVELAPTARTPGAPKNPAGPVERPSAKRIATVAEPRSPLSRIVTRAVSPGANVGRSRD